MENWKDIPGYEGIYQISDNGNTRSFHINGANRKLKTDSDGYLMVVLCKNAKYETKKVHRLVGMAFLENPYDFPEINHKDENKTNNAVDNLEWCTKRYNLNYGTARRRQVENTDYNKIAMKNRKEIIQLDENGKAIGAWKGVVEAAKSLNIERRTISSCLHGKTKSAGGYGWKLLGASGE